MHVDLDSLRRQYASLSDHALLEIDRSELIEAAQDCYDEELRQRKLRSRVVIGEDDDSDRPHWIEEATEVFSRQEWPGQEAAQQIDSARAALEAAGIPCHVEVSDEGEPPMRNWRLIVPGHLNLHATSVLDRDIFNVDFESDWKTHLQMLADSELAEMNPEAVFCGLFDRVERVKRVYAEEITRRGLESADQLSL